ncbi:hypothetical protein ACQ4PT_054708 [Festuca glaucescens]
MAVAVVLLLLLTASAVESAGSSSTVVAGMVFCDQCKDGARGLFDYPLYGARVAIQCGGGDTPMTVRECSTNWFGGFSVRMEGSPDMNRCTARVVHASGHCSDSGAAEPRELTLAFRMLGLALYTVQPLLSQPDKPMDFCPAVPHAPPAPAAVAANAPSSSPPAPPLSVAPVSSPAPPLPPFWRRRPRLLPPIWRRPPTVPQERPALPNPEPQPLPTPPPPSTPPPSQGSACAYDRWAVPEHRCHWKVVTPNTTVAMAFGPLAAQRYGPDMTLREALDGRGDAYRTLLREATAALLNAYYNAPGGPFLYPTTASVIDHLNGALLSSAQRVLIEGARFRRANAGGGGPAGRTKLPCELAPCGYVLIYMPCMGLGSFLMLVLSHGVTGRGDSARDTAEAAYVGRLGRCRCVSRRWHGILTDPSFINRHVEAAHIVSGSCAETLVVTENRGCGIGLEMVVFTPTLGNKPICHITHLCGGYYPASTCNGFLLLRLARVRVQSNHRPARS